MSADQIADLIRRVEQIERRLGIRSEPQEIGGSKPSETVATFERDDNPGGVSPVRRVMPKEKPDKSS
jgi:hypothetical protein